MMHRNKSVLLSCILIVCLLFLVGCNGKNPSHERLRDTQTSIDSFSASDLRISGVSLSSSSSYITATGTVTNNGSRTVRFVEVKAAFKNSSGKVVDTDWTYAVGSEGLSPGESTKFSIMVDKDYSINDCSVTVQDYD